jgi:formamidopyrimidine-DNA glycosylase
MAEGPQAKLCAERLGRQLAGREILACDASRAPLARFADQVVGRRCQRVFCKGKHIFLEFDGELMLHNHLLMRGRWRKLDGRMLFLPDGIWVGLYVGPYTVCNERGQMLRAETKQQVETCLDSLGPDVMAEPYPADAIRRRIAADGRPIAEVILDQSVVCGIGNVAKSETLFLAGLDPRTPATLLEEADVNRLVAQMHSVCMESYNKGGRWTHRIYQRRGQACPSCGGRILRIVQAGRATFFCPSCQH